MNLQAFREVPDQRCEAFMEGKKTYSKTKSYIFNTVYDIIELQKGDLILSDTRLGRLQYQITQYGYIWELMYLINEKGANKSEVTLSVIGERKDKAKEISREFALLDSMLEGSSSVKFT